MSQIFDMKFRVQFISLEQDEKDLIVSFAIPDEKTGVKSLILHRTLFFEEMLPEEERGVRVSLEDDYFDQEDYNMLNIIRVDSDEIVIKSTFREYRLDMSNMQHSEMEDMIKLLERQNYDNKFAIKIA